jgi:hypothetical protein
MIRLKAILNGYEISPFPFHSWAATVEAVERKGVKILRYWADRTPEVDHKGIVIRVHFEVLRSTVALPAAPDSARSRRRAALGQ